MTTRPAASVTSPQGIEIIKELISAIDANDQLSRNEFGKSVRMALKSMQARLTDGAFFSQKMEDALQNWGQAIHRDDNGEARKKGALI